MNKIDSMNGDELSWLTERYLLGELDEASRDALEARLAVDQDAREALANAVSLLAAVRLAAPSVLDPAPARSRPDNRWNLRNTWLAGVAAAILVGAFWLSHNDWTGVESKKELAKAWVETRELSIDAAAELELISPESAPLSSDESEAPDWLITAVSLSTTSESEAKSPAANPQSGEGA